MPDFSSPAKQGDSLFDGGNLRDDLERRAYPELDRKKRRAVRRIFLYGLLHTDAMHYAIWGVNEIGAGEGSSPDSPVAVQMLRDNRRSMADLLAPIPPPEPVDEIRYEHGDGETETMILRSGSQFVTWLYTTTDCYRVRWIRLSLFRSKPVRVLDPDLLEAKRREMFGYAYEELVRHVASG